MITIRVRAVRSYGQRREFRKFALEKLPGFRHAENVPENKSEERFQRFCGRNPILETMMEATIYEETMHTGTLIEELLAAVDQAMTGASREKQRTRFFVWDTASRERALEMQNNLAGVA